ncbi:hypothetical protein F4693_003590 [Sphingomonas endophytica]|uniref:Lipoprotein n=1 Tax=Sphingomonas endophytica TaxID=869719 RepID=A0A7X0MQX1_9SPHN|nr:hypothetical protein [Sphingomonas endophytica]MBB6506585.1 hypothetical protein [Sphingomonas endophytica]
MTKRLFLLAVPLALAACAQPAPDPSPSATPTERVGPLAPPRDGPGDGQLRDNALEPAATAALEERYLGRWIGVEGTFLDVTRREAGGVTLDMQWDLDHRGTFDGSVAAEGLRFMRNGIAETAVPGNGDATGLKWLAGKKDCLIVKSGEGYCRK